MLLSQLAATLVVAITFAQSAPQNGEMSMQEMIDYINSLNTTWKVSI